MGQNYSRVYQCNVQQQLSYSEMIHRDTMMNKTVIQYWNKTVTHLHDYVNLHGAGQETVIVVTVVVVIGVLCMVIAVACMVSIKYKFGGGSIFQEGLGVSLNITIFLQWWARCRRPDLREQSNDVLLEHM